MTSLRKYDIIKTKIRYLTYFGGVMIKNEKLMRLVFRVAALSRRNAQGESKNEHRGHGQILASLVSERENGGISQQLLADRVGIRPQSLSEALASLEKQGYIVRSVSPVDKRKTLVSITDAGIEQSRYLAEERAQRADRVFGVLNDDEREALCAILSKLIENADSL